MAAAEPIPGLDCTGALAALCEAHPRMDPPAGHASAAGTVAAAIPAAGRRLAAMGPASQSDHPLCHWGCADGSLDHPWRQLSGHIRTPRGEANPLVVAAGTDGVVCRGDGGGGNVPPSGRDYESEAEVQASGSGGEDQAPGSGGDVRVRGSGAHVCEVAAAVSVGALRVRQCGVRGPSKAWEESHLGLPGANNHRARVACACVMRSKK